MARCRRWLFGLFFVAGIAQASAARSIPAWEPARTWVLAVGVVRWENPRIGRFDPEGRRDRELIQILRDRGVSAERLVYLEDEAATGRAIRRGLRSILRRSRPGDSLIVYYGGHGGLWEDGLYFLPYDARAGRETHWSLRRLLASIDRSFRGSLVMLIGDCCYSGAIVEAARAYRGRLHVVGMGASQRELPSTWRWSFTNTVIEGFAGYRPVDHDRNGTLSLTELGRYVSREMAIGEGQLGEVGSATGVPDYRLSTAVGSRNRLIGRHVEVSHGRHWYRARIRDVRPGAYLVQYYRVAEDGFDDDGETRVWLPRSRLRRHQPVQLPQDTAVEVYVAGDWHVGRVVGSRYGLHQVFVHDDSVSPQTLWVGEDDLWTY